ncbi:MAG: trimethylamine methyltransferase family protein [Alphaproteobacteria bacterium]|nr:trimethylamine methyltransferase family protein [Alphaproteobacteria bacterium]
MTRGSAPRRARRGNTGIRQSPWRRLVNPYEPVGVLSTDQVEAIHEASLGILEELGIEFLLPEALDHLRRAGADVAAGGPLVRFDRGLVAEAVAKAPGRFTLHARNPARNLEVGGNAIAFACVGSAPNASDIDGGRRPGNRRDFENLVRLGQALDSVHAFGGYPVEPIDLPAATRHLDCLHAFITLGDKVYRPYALGAVRIADAIAMTRIARGLSPERLQEEPSLYTNINVNSPRRIDGPMLAGVMEMARWNQPVVVTPFTLAGAMSPASLAGSLAQQNAEALAGIAFCQILRPGMPVVYGGFTSNVDMRTGAPAFGTPEYARAALAGGQLARRYGLPYRSSNANAANAVDAQAAYESQASLWSAVMGHANLVMHAAGWMEGGLVASFEKMVLDAELLQAMAAFLEPIKVDDDTLALDAQREIAPGGHFFGAAHTLQRYETAFYAPLVSDWRNNETWREAGSPDAARHANRIWKQLLKEYQPPALDAAIRDELDAYVARRKREGDVAMG